MRWQSSSLLEPKTAPTSFLLPGVSGALSTLFSPTGPVRGATRYPRHLRTPEAMRAVNDAITACEGAEGRIRLSPMWEPSGCHQLSLPAFEAHLGGGLPQKITET